MRTQKEIKKEMGDLVDLAYKTGRGFKYDDVQVELLMDIRGLLKLISSNLKKST